MERRTSIGSAVCILFFTFSITATADNTTPIKLTDSQLDTINAGFVELTITANASAFGSDVVSLAVANTNTRSNKGGQTVATGSGISTAIGDIVFTETGYILNTDENILSLKTIQRLQNSETGKITIRTRIHKNGRVTIKTIEQPPKNNRGNRNRQITETNTLRVRAVTRR